MNNFNFSKIGYINGSSKLGKGKAYNVNTFGVYLAPSNLSGRNVCSMATNECIKGCLNTSGRVKMDVKNLIVTARINRTIAFYEQRENFMAELVKEIRLAMNKSKRQGKKFAVRINCTSDLSLEIFKHEGKNLLEIFPNVLFYDYTKVPNRIKLVEKYKNYDLTFSYSGYNWSDCETMLKNNVRIAVIFDVQKGKPLPKTFNGYKVIDGDLSDYRPKDKKNVIVGLRWKQIANKANNELIKNSPFVVKANGQKNVVVTDNVQTLKIAA